MANEEHLAILKQGVEAWNKWRTENPDIEPDLFGADLAATNLNGADLTKTNLNKADLYAAHFNGAKLNGATLEAVYARQTSFYKADFSNANLSWANFNTAYLVGAKFVEANCSDTDFSHADLAEADFDGAFLAPVNLSGANLNGTNFEHSTMAGAALGDVDLSVVKGLDLVAHPGTSTVGIDTIYKSKGKIPPAFLRECGVPDAMIAFIASLAGQPETNRVRLRMMIDEHFNKSELQTLCFDMGVDYDSLDGENKSDKARELVAYYQRRGTIRNLVAKCKDLHPNLSWEGEYE